MEAEEIKRIDREHHLHSWSVQGALNPLVFDHGQGVYFWDSEGKRYLDMSSQLMNLNIGYNHPRVIDAIKKQAEKAAYCGPGFALDSRSEVLARLTKITPGDLDYFFFTLSGAESNENAIKIARLFTGKQKIIARYLSYHGASYGAISLTGDPRRPPVEPGIPGVVHVRDPFCYRCPYGQTYPGCGIQCAKEIEDVIAYEEPSTVAAVIVEGITGSNGIFVPPTEYYKRLREICDKNNVMLISDEVMSGFGRTGAWFGIDNFGVVPDIMVMAKGLTCGYVPMGAVAVSKKIWEHFRDKMLWCGLTYNAHPLACGAAAACLDVYKEEGLVENARKLGGELLHELEALKQKHPCVGDVRGKGLFAAIDLVKDRQTKEPLIPWNAKGADGALTKEINGRLLRGGVSTQVRWNWIFLAPPLVINLEQLREGLKVIDETLTFVDSKIG